MDVAVATTHFAKMFSVGSDIRTFSPVFYNKPNLIATAETF